MSQSVYFVHLIPTGGKYTGDAECIFDFCLMKGIVGVGWALGEDFTATSNFTEYEEKYPEFHGPVLDSSIKTIRDMKKGDLVWTRNADREFYLSEVRGRWNYEGLPLNRAFDIVNVRKVETWKISRADTPTEIIQTSYRRAAQEIHDQSGIAWTKDLWSRLYTEEAYPA